MKNYKPSDKILERYADVLVNFALGGGKGIKKGEVVYLMAEESAKPLYLELRKAIWKSGGHIISSYIPSNDEEYNVEKDFFIHAGLHQLDFFPEHHLKGLIKQIDHSIFIISEGNKQALTGIDPKKIMRASKSMKPYMEWRNEKENSGKFTWTLALYGTPAMAKEAQMTVEEYWDQSSMRAFLKKKNQF